MNQSAEPRAPAKGRDSEIRSVLRSLMSTTDAGINAVAAMTSDGLLIASIMKASVDADRFAAMSASLLALAEREINEIERGNLVQLLIEGTEGAVLLVQAGRNAVLAVSTDPGALIGKIFIQARQTAGKLQAMLE